ncbi:MAG: glycosyl hydrolase family 28 protein [Oscillospiraceae bacterium]|nr:glycosyl hydrolase family 28 protein [Oscillospiraceae bacterium]
MKRVNISDFGAVPDTDDIQTKKFQDAIDYCFESGGGEVIVPEGRYIIGDIRLRSNITLHLMENAHLLGSINPEDYLNIFNDKFEPLPADEMTDILWKSPYERTEQEGKELLGCAGSRWHYGIIRILFAENVSVIGEKGSVIDGRNCYDEKGEQRYRGPHGINVHKSESLHFSGYTIQHTGNWAHCIFSSKNISVENVTVLGGHDGIHFRGCDDVTVKKCVIKVGDDGIAGFDNTDFSVTDCYLSSARNVFRIGGTNVLVDRCISEGPCEYPFRYFFTEEEKKKRAYKSVSEHKNTPVFFKYFVDTTRNIRHQPGNIVVRNCKVSGVETMFNLNLSGSEIWQKGIPPKDITFENIDFIGASNTSILYGNDAVPLELCMKNINYSLGKGFEKIPFLHMGKHGKVVVDNVKINNFDGDVLIRDLDGSKNVEISNLQCDNFGSFKII